MIIDSDIVELVSLFMSAFGIGLASSFLLRVFVKASARVR